MTVASCQSILLTAIGLYQLAPATLPAQAPPVYKGQTTSLCAAPIEGATYVWELYCDSCGNFATTPGNCHNGEAVFTQGIRDQPVVQIRWNKAGLFFYKLLIFSPEGCTNFKIGRQEVFEPLIFAAGSSSTRCQGPGVETYTATANKDDLITYEIDSASRSCGNSIDALCGSLTFAPEWSGVSTIIARVISDTRPQTAVHIITTTPSVDLPVFTAGAASDRIAGAGMVSCSAVAAHSTHLVFHLDNFSLASGNRIDSTSGAVGFVSTWTGTSYITATADGCNGPVSATHALITFGPKLIRVTASPRQSKIYGTEDPAFEFTSSPGPDPGDCFQGALSREPGEHPGSYAIRRGTLTAGPKYVLAFEPDSFRISPKILSISAVAANKKYDGTTATHILLGFFHGVLPGDQVSMSGGQASFESPEAGSGKKVDISGFKLSGPDAGNYGLSNEISGIADILPLNLSPSLTSACTTLTQPDDPVTLTATIPGGAPVDGRSSAALSAIFSCKGNPLRGFGLGTAMPLYVSGADLTATLTFNLSNLPTDGPMTPGVKTFEATFFSDNQNYTLTPNPASVAIMYAPAMDIRVFPNPSFQESLSFSILLSKGSPVTIDLFSTDGQLISRIFDDHLPGGVTRTVVYRNTLPQGVYLYQVRTAKQVASGRIVVIREY